MLRPMATCWMSYYTTNNSETIAAYINLEKEIYRKKDW